MNKHLYRIVFNRALGLLQAVSELVRRPGRGASRSDGLVAVTVRPVSLGLWAAFGWIGIASVASAQITSDMHAPGNQRPTVMGSSNAAPLINITTPSKAGVSRNTYSDFNVGRDGAVLNNSRTNTATQLAGTVAGNPWLATGTAKVILNEVNGPNPSALNGVIEVAGDRAQVIVANPAGISCDGCGVINANRFTLTTGTPILNGGALDGYRVSGGTVQVNGKGLDATSADYTDIIARAVQVNGSIWSPQLQVTTGANEVSADHTQVTAINGTGDKPAFALDVSALGGMYANKIVLLGTEHGVGARNAGSIGAQAGDLVVTVDGRLENTGSLQSQANTQIAASGGVSNAKMISASRELTIYTPADVDNSGGTLNAARVAVDAASLRNAGGTIEQTGSQGMSLDAGALSNRNGGRIGMVQADAGSGGSSGTPSDPSSPATGTPGNGSSGETPATGGDVPAVVPPVPLADGVLHIAGLLDNDGGNIRAAAGFDLSSGTGLANDGGQLALRALTLTGGNLSNRGGTLVIDGASTVHANQVNNDGGQLTFAKAVALDAQGLSNRSGTLTLADAAPMTLTVAGTLDNTGGTLASHAGALTLNAGTFINERGTLNHAGADGFTLHTGDWLGAKGSVVTGGAANVTAATIDHQGATLSATQLTLHAANLDNSGGFLVTSGATDNTLDVTGTLDNGNGGRIQTAGDVSIAADTLGNAGGSVRQQGQGMLAIQAGAVQGRGGELLSAGGLSLAGGAFDLANGTTQAQRIAANVDALTTAGGSFTSLGGTPLQLTVQGLLDNSGGTLIANGAWQFDVGALTNIGGHLIAAGRDASRITGAGALDNTRGELSAAGATTVHSGSLLNQGGLLRATDGAPLTLAVDGLLDNSQHGQVLSNGDLALAASTLDNTLGNISHGGNGTLAIQASTLNGQGGTILSKGTLNLTGLAVNLSGSVTQAQTITVVANALDNSGGATLHALGSDPLTLRVRGTLNNRDGNIVNDNGALQLGAGALINTGGHLTANGNGATDITVARLFDNTRGELTVMGATTIHGGTLVNQGGTLQVGNGAALRIQANGLLDNSAKGNITSTGDLTVNASMLDNTGGGIWHTGQGTAAVTANTLNGQGGTIASEGALVLTGGAVDLRGATTQAQTITVNADTLDHSGAAMLHALGGEPLTLRVRGTLNNSGSWIVNDQGALQLSAGAFTNTGGKVWLFGTGATDIAVAGVFDSTRGELSTKGATTVHAGDLINQGGVIQVDGDAALSLTADGLLDNSQQGKVIATGDLTVHAATLDNTQGAMQHAGQGVATITAGTLHGQGGTLASNGALTLTGGAFDLRGATTQAQTISIDATSLDHTAGATLQALGSDALTVRVRDTLDNSGSKMLTNGALMLSAESLRNQGGILSAAGSGASALSIRGVFDNSAGGLLATTGTTTLHAGSLDNTAGVIQAASSDVLTVTTDGALINDQGTLVTNGALALTAGAMNNHGGTVQAQQAMGVNVAGSLDNNGGAMVAGGDLAVKAQSLFNRDTLSSDASATPLGLYGQRVTLDAATLDNRQGHVQARDALNVTASTLTNVGGVLDGTGLVNVAAATLDNTRGQLVQRGDSGVLTVDISQSLTNAAGGLIGAEGTANLQAGLIDNSGGTTFARHGLNLVSHGDLLNRNGGQLQANGSLTLNAQGTLDNSGGSIDATQAAAISANVISNVGGQILAGNSGSPDAGLTMASANGIDNRGGTLGNRGGDVTLQAAGVDNSAGGTLVAQRDLILDGVASLTNTGGTTYATRNLSVQNANATLDNTGGTLLGAGGTAWLNLATLTNSGGHVQADTLWLTTPVLTNDGGDIGANQLHATLTTLNGLGTLHGTDALDVHFLGDYTHLAGQQLQSDGTLTLTVDGTLTNQGTLQTQGELDVTAAQLINQRTINASNTDGTARATLNVAGRIDNQAGASIEADTLTLNATDVTNTSSQGITGNAVRINADTLTNGRDLGQADAAQAYGEGFIGAAQTLELRIAQHLANLDGDIYSGGDLAIAGRADGTRVATLDNVSGRIQADGDGRIAADTINNRRRVVETEQYTLSADEQYALSSERQYDAVYASLSPAEQQALANMGQNPPKPSGLSAADERALFAKLGWVHVDDASAIDPALKTALDTTYRNRAVNEFGLKDGYFIGPVAADVKQFDTYLTGTRVTRASADSQILTGGNLDIDLGTHLTNFASTIAATGDLTINGQHNDGSADARIDNIAITGSYTGERTTTAWTREGAPAAYQKTDGSWATNPAAQEEGSVTQDMTFAGPVLVAATISGRNVSLSGHDVTNTAVAASGGITTWSGDNLAGPGSTALDVATNAQVGRANGADGAHGTTVSGGNDVGGVQRQAVNGIGSVDRTQGKAVNGAGTVAGAGAQVIGSADQPLPGLVAPSGGRYSQNGDPASPFLVTTAPRFATGAVTSSDYLLRALGQDPGNIHKRLGDAYVEQNLVLDQLLQLTGRRVINGGDGLAQYQALMDGAAAEAARQGLQLGAPLTASQIAALSSDIVWLVDQVVDGQHVLVPVVYLSKHTAERLRSDGALIAGDNVDLKASGTVRNDGTITGTQNVTISADTLINRHAIKAGDQLAIATRNDTLNLGTLSGNAVGIVAGGSVINAPAFDGVAAHGGTITAGTGGVQIVAVNDVINQGKIESQGNANIVAGRDYVQNAAVSSSTAHAAAGSLSANGNAAVIAGRDAIFDQSTLSAGKVAYIDAGRDAAFNAATVSGGTGVGVVAGRDIVSTTVTDHSASGQFTRNGKNWSSTTTTDDTVRGSTFTSGGDVTMQAGRDISLTAANVNAEGAVGISAGRDINLGAGQNTHTETTDSRSKHGNAKTTTHNEADDTDHGRHHHQRRSRRRDERRPGHQRPRRHRHQQRRRRGDARRPRHQPAGWPEHAQRNHRHPNHQERLSQQERNHHPRCHLRHDRRWHHD
ncbi:filamentous hemagglutinin family N-terminal domain-containing protein [Dyella jiangningensis]|nr:filamentous hemagglutinin family protein [Dyella sp. AtDHG13]SDL23676.1 filamentous hemagglutinin family N-terminal domain-containing protein [Dyella jiangningensis]